MTEKKCPLTATELTRLCERVPTPFHLYDEQAMIDNARTFQNAFSWNKGFKEFFALKANPNPAILKVLHRQGFGVDCSSMAELVMAEKCGLKGEEIFFSSNDTPAAEYRKAFELGAIINLDDISHLPFLFSHAGVPDIISFRFNPGPERSGNAIIGNPVEAKYGCTRQQLFEGYKAAKEKGVKRFGIHTMIISNELNPDSFVETGDMMFQLVAELSATLGITFDFVNLGGGIGVPYHPEDSAVDVDRVSRGIRERYEEHIVKNGLEPLAVFAESGRMITGPYGCLVTRVLHKKETYKTFIGVDACMADLMRPALYGAYHHISVVGKESSSEREVYDITGSLCENNDKFAIDRSLPPIEIGDLLVIHDTGAHGHAMGFNYNGKLRSAELLLRPDGTTMEIRRAETLEDYFATLDFSIVDKV